MPKHKMHSKPSAADIAEVRSGKGSARDKREVGAYLKKGNGKMKKR